MEEVDKLIYGIIYKDKKTKNIVRWDEDNKALHYLGSTGKYPCDKYNFGDGGWEDVPSRYELATGEEAYWLYRCICLGKWMSKEKALETFENEYRKIY